MSYFPIDVDGQAAWMMRGDGIAAGTGRIWEPIARGLNAGRDVECLRGGDTVLSRGDVLDLLGRFADVMPAGGRIGLRMARSLASVVATLAIWQAGAAYVPLALEHPLARVAAMAINCGLDLIIADTPLDLAGYRPAGTTMVLGEALLFYAPTNRRAPEPDDGALCYIAHTSATTGAPKAVMVSHAAVLHRMACMRAMLRILPTDRFLYKASAVFDVHIWEFVLPLVSMCRLSVYPQAAMFNLAAVIKLAAADGTTVLGLVPTLLGLALTSAAFTANRSLRAVFCGGEAWDIGLARRFQQKLPGCVLYNSYGPAETTLAVSNWRVPDDPACEAIELGAPLGETVFIVLPRPGDAADGRIVGELLIGGPQLALGYAGGIGADRFAEHVVGGRRLRLYASGDVVGLDPASGALRFLHREDCQIKVNGVRIELEEIEAAIRALPEIEGCAACLSQAGSAQLWAAYTTHTGRPADDRRIRAACAARLPAVAVPARFCHVPVLPLRPSGKIDRACLPRLLAAVLLAPAPREREAVDAA